MVHCIHIYFTSNIFFLPSCMRERKETVISIEYRIHLVQQSNKVQVEWKVSSLSSILPQKRATHHLSSFAHPSPNPSISTPRPAPTDVAPLPPYCPASRHPPACTSPAYPEARPPEGVVKELRRFLRGSTGTDASPMYCV